LLACWTPYDSYACHNIWHGAGFGSSWEAKRDRIERTIKEILLEDDYKTFLLIQDKMAARPDKAMLKLWMEGEIKEMERKK
jgi:hypothetical protein